MDRAIRIHQNIIARPDLPAEQKDQALLSLAKDYLRAGLLDRAEKMFVRLAQGSRHQLEALEQLCRIYEQEREWQKAIESGQKLEVLSGRSLGEPSLASTRRTRTWIDEPCLPVCISVDAFRNYHSMFLSREL